MKNLNELLKIEWEREDLSKKIEIETLLSGNGTWTKTGYASLLDLDVDGKLIEIPVDCSKFRYFIFQMQDRDKWKLYRCKNE